MVTEFAAESATPSLHAICGLITSWFVCKLKMLIICGPGLHFEDIHVVIQNSAKALAIIYSEVPEARHLISLTLQNVVSEIVLFLTLSLCHSVPVCF